MNSTIVKDSRRSVSLATGSPFAEVDGVSFVSLRNGPPAVQVPLTELLSYDWTNELEDFTALVDDLDLVISVDISVAYLAGALGKPLRLLDRSTHAGGGWKSEMTIRLRQPAIDNWSAVINEVRHVLQAIAGPRPETIAAGSPA